MAAATLSISEAADAALASMNKTSTETTDPKTEPVVETKDETTEEPVIEEPVKNQDASPEEIQEALNFARAMKDPALAPAMIEYLATRSGFTKAEIVKATPTEQKEIVKEIKSILPPGFEYLEEALLPAIKRMIKEGVDEGTKELRGTVEQDNIKRLEKVVIDTTTEFGKLHYEGKEVPANVITEVNRLSNIYTPQPGVDPKDHVMNLLIIARGRVDPNNTSSTKPGVQKLTPKASVKNVLSSQKTATTDGSGNDKPKLSLEDSIQEALKSLQLDS